MRICLLLLGIFHSVWLFSQNWQVYGAIRTEEGEPLEGASVYIDDFTGVITGGDGLYRISTPERPVQLIVQRLGYFSRRIVLEEKDFVSGKRLLDVTLTSQFLSLPVVDVVAPKVQVLIEEDFSMDLYDYEFAGRNLLLLVRDKKRHLLRLTDESGQIISELPLAGSPHQLHRSCTGGLHIIGPDFSQELIVNGVELDTFPRYDTRKFRAFIEPCVLKSDRYYIYRHAALLNQEISYTYYDNYGGRHPLTQIRNRSAIREAFRAYRQFLNNAPFVVRAEGTPASDPINKDFTFDELFDEQNPPLEISKLLPLAESANQVAWLGALKTIEQDSAYAPLFKIDNQILIFDHVNGELQRYDDLFRSEGNTAIAYQTARGWKKELLKDDVTQELYAHFAPDGLHRLEKIDPENGHIVHTYPLGEVRYLSANFKIRDGHLYYIGQDNVNIPNHKLYKVDIAQRNKP